MDKAAKGTSRNRKENTNKGKVEKDIFDWEDEEVELFLSCVADYKAERIVEGIDWKRVKENIKIFVG